MNPRFAFTCLLLLLLLGAPACELAAQDDEGLATVESSLAEARVHLVFGIRAYRLGDFEGAVARFEKAVTLAPSIEAAQTAQSWLERARRAQGGEVEALEGLAAAPGILTFLERPRTEFRVGLTASTDSNPLLLPEGSVGVLPDGSVVFDTPSDTALNLDVRVAIHPFYDRGGWSLGLVFDGDLVRYNDFGVTDLDQLRGTVQLAWGGDPLAYLPGPLGFTRVPRGGGKTAFLLQGSFTDRRLDGDGLEQLLQVGATFMVRPCATTATHLELLYTDRDVEAPLAGGNAADGDEWSFGVSQFIYLGDRARHLRLGVETGERDAGPAFESAHIVLEAELALPLSEHWALQLGAARREVDFDNLESNPLLFSFPAAADRPREDTVDQWAAALIWQPRPSLRILLRGARVERDTDIGSATTFLPLDYERDTASLGVVWLF